MLHPGPGGWMATALGEYLEMNQSCCVGSSVTAPTPSAPRGSVLPGLEMAAALCTVISIFTAKSGLVGSDKLGSAL